MNIPFLSELVISALSSSRRGILGFGYDGLMSAMGANRFGESALLADMVSEKEMIKGLEASGLSFQVYSEEHNEFTIGEDPSLSVFMDGIDGSKAFSRGRPSGTMLSIYQGLNPTFDDYLVSEVILHPSGNLFIARKGNGTRLIDERSIGHRVHTSGIAALDHNTRLGIDVHWDFVRQFYASIINDFKFDPADSTAVQFTELAHGKLAAILQCTRKDSLELAVGYPLVREAGGIVVDEHCRDLGSIHYLEFGHGLEHRPYIATTNMGLAQIILDRNV